MHFENASGAQHERGIASRLLLSAACQRPRARALKAARRTHKPHPRSHALSECVICTARCKWSPAGPFCRDDARKQASLSPCFASLWQRIAQANSKDQALIDSCRRRCCARAGGNDAARAVLRTAKLAQIWPAAQRQPCVRGPAHTACCTVSGARAAGQWRLHAMCCAAGDVNRRLMHAGGQPPMTMVEPARGAAAYAPDADMLISPRDAPSANENRADVRSRRPKQAVSTVSVWTCCCVARTFTRVEAMACRAAGLRRGWRGDAVRTPNAFQGDHQRPQDGLHTEHRVAAVAARVPLRRRRAARDARGRRDAPRHGRLARDDAWPRQQLHPRVARRAGLCGGGRRRARWPPPHAPLPPPPRHTGLCYRRRVQHRRRHAPPRLGHRHAGAAARRRHARAGRQRAVQTRRSRRRRRRNLAHRALHGGDEQGQHRGHAAVSRAE